MASDFRLKDRLPALTARIVATYEQVPSINHLGHCPLPNYDVVVGVIEDLKEILYPGYRRREGLHLGNVTYHVGDLIDGLHDKLTTQFGRALRHSAGKSRDCQSEEAEDFDALGQAKALDFLDRIPDVRKALALDAQAAVDGDPAVKHVDEVIFCYPGFEAVTWIGLLAPAGTPKEIVARMHREIEKIVQMPEVQERLSASGAEPVASTPEQFGAYLSAEVAKWGRVVKQAKIPPVQ